MSSGKISALAGGVGDGWRPLLDKLEQDLDEIDPDYRVLQVKEKFGGMRCYIIGSKEAYEIVREAEGKSYSICEQCGKPGVMTLPVGSRYGWYLTLCEACQGDERRPVP